MIQRAYRKKMVVLLSVLFTLIFLLSFSSNALGDHGHKKATPYGDYCSRMSHYGMHKSIINMKHAEEALHHYYGERGLDIEIVGKDGRFLKVKVVDKDKVVDTVIFDRRSGRIRSVY